MGTKNDFRCGLFGIACLDESSKSTLRGRARARIAVGSPIVDCMSALLIGHRVHNAGFYRRSYMAAVTDWRQIAFENL